MRCRDLLLCSVAFGLALGLATASAEESRPAAAFAVPPLSAAESAAAFAPDRKSVV